MIKFEARSAILVFPVFATNALDAYILFAAFFFWIVPELVWFRLRGPRLSQGQIERFSGPLLMAAIWIGIWGSLNIAFALPQAAIPWHRGLVFGTGIILMLAGVAFRLYSIRILGKYFTTVITTQPGQTVVENGPYRWIRHPSYSGALLTLFGLGLTLGNWLSLIVIMVATILGYSYRIFVEEKALAVSLGDPYREYMKHTKRIIPFVI